MKNQRLFRRTTLAVAVALCLLAGGAAGASVELEQTIELQPGWNSIWLEVQPDPADLESVFGGLPVAGVWHWSVGTSRVQYIQNPGDYLIDHPGWLGWFPPGPQHFLTNLHRLQANRAYLVNYAGDAPVSMVVTGRPSLRDLDWTPDSFSLVGFPVDPSLPPTFGDFLAPSAAHAGQPIYRLGAGGQWEEVSNPDAATIRRGEAYWVYSDGPSNYTAPIGIELEQGDGLDYDDVLVERSLRFRNLGAGHTGITVRALPAGLPLSYWTIATETDPDTAQEFKRIAWPDLGPDHQVGVNHGDTAVLRLGVRRARFSSERLEGILEVKDGAGTLRFISLSAKTRRAGKPAPVETDSGVDGGIPYLNHLQQTAGATSSNLLVGLWVGTVIVDAVSEPASAGDPLTPAGTEFGFRLILHVDEGGTVRLLKQVTEMWEDGTLDTDGFLATSGRNVLISDDDLLSAYKGSSMRDGESVGHRVSSAGYDFSGPSGEPLSYLELAGSFAAGGSLTGTLQLSANAPTNPFRHDYHPDHDDDYFAATDPMENPTIQREWTLDLAIDDPAGLDPLEWGYTIMAGTFTETIRNLRNDDIVAAGSFRISRVSEVTALNE